MFLCADCLEKQTEDKTPKNINYECIDCDEEVTCDTLPEGWKQVSGCDYCPACAAELEEEETFTIYVLEDGETWSRAKPNVMKVTAAEMERLKDGEHPRYLKDYYDRATESEK
jgi:hypothetical protein